MDATKHNGHDVADSAKEAVMDLKKNVQQVGRKAVDTAKVVAQEFSDTSMDTIKSYTKAYKKEGKKQLRTVESYIQKNPVKSVVISAFAGILISKILK